MIGGIWSLKQIETRGIEYGMIAVFTFGGAYLLSGPWRDLPAKAMVLSLLAVAGTAFGAQYVPYDFPYIYFGVNQGITFYQAWGGLVFLVGIPLMTIVFYYHDQ